MLMAKCAEIPSRLTADSRISPFVSLVAPLGDTVISDQLGNLLHHGGSSFEDVKVDRWSSAKVVVINRGDAFLTLTSGGHRHMDLLQRHHPRHNREGLRIMLYSRYASVSSSNH